MRTGSCGTVCSSPGRRGPWRTDPPSPPGTGPSPPGTQPRGIRHSPRAQQTDRTWSAAVLRSAGALNIQIWIRRFMFFFSLSK